MKEWYLIGNNTKPNMLGGYEDEGFLDYKDYTINDVLESELGTTAILYNYDLSVSKEIRVIVQGNTADTQLKSMERTVLASIGTLHSGDYIYFENEYWIIDGRVGNNKVYEKATLKECQYKLRWQRNDGKIIERWANLISASKYDVGENASYNNLIVLTSNNYTIVIPNDKDSQTIYGKRLFIDLSEVPEKVFKITRNDDVLFNHPNNGGTLSVIADKTELNKETDNQELRLCDYISDTTTLPPSNESNNPVNSSKNILASISGKTDLMNGFSRSYTAILIDSDKNTIEWNDSKYSWKVECDFVDDIVQESTGNKIKLSVDNENLIDRSFVLHVVELNDNVVIGSIEINICEL